MLELHSDWIIVGESGRTYGSFNDREKAIEYCDALRVHRKLSCRVVSKEEYRQ